MAMSPFYAPDPDEYIEDDYLTADEMREMDSIDEQDRRELDENGPA